jgi:acetyl-CoA carboxylase carboxyl transferase subunit beta
MTTPSGPRRVAAVGAVARGADGRILLVRRGNEPDRGTWSLPGGRVEPGESAEAAVVRETHEETGLHVRVVQRIATLERPHPEGGVYVIDDFAVEIIAGDLHAGSDALDAAWFDADAVRACNASPGLIDALDAWGLLTP